MKSGIRKGGKAIANEIIFTELRFRNVSPARLAKALGLTEKVLMQVLRFELDEQEQLAELQFGVEKSLFPEKNTAALCQFLVALNVLSFDDQAAVEYGRICAYLQKRGTPIGTMDMLIAAHAKAADLTLVTNNTREFARVPDLALDNWT